MVQREDFITPVRVGFTAGVEPERSKFVFSLKVPNIKFCSTYTLSMYSHGGEILLFTCPDSA